MTCPPSSFNFQLKGFEHSEPFDGQFARGAFFRRLAMPRFIPSLTRFYMRNSRVVDDILGALVLVALVAVLVFLPELLP